MIRPATPEDAAAIGDVFIRARDRMAFLPRIPDAYRPKLGGWTVARHEIWVGDEVSDVVGFAGLSPGWLDRLYVDPGHHGHRIGSALALPDHAAALHPAGSPCDAVSRGAQDVGVRERAAGSSASCRPRI